MEQGREQGMLALSSRAMRRGKMRKKGKGEIGRKKEGVKSLPFGSSKLLCLLHYLWNCSLT